MPLRDSTKALLAVAVPLLTTLALGVALILAFGRNSGGPRTSTTAPVPPPLVPAVSVSAPPSSSHICAPRQRSATSFAAASGIVAVTPDPTSVTALWLNGPDPSTCRDAITRGAQALSAELAVALDDEPVVGRGIFMCPMDDGSSVVLYFGYGEGHPSEVVTVALSGCLFISDPGRESRWWLRPGMRSNFGHMLETLAPSPWRSSILASLQAS